MRMLTKSLVGICVVTLTCSAFGFFQARRARSAAEGIRNSLVRGDPKEKVERVMREYGLQPEIGMDGRSYTAWAWIPLGQDIEVTVVLNGHWEVGMIFVKD